uniref:E3 ubiquitin-protein ligase RFWD3 n=1 Tax=Rhizophora mucronata TaxID=61149 RepID=A0A2P2P3Q3_RHIMU
MPTTKTTDMMVTLSSTRFHANWARQALGFSLARLAPLGTSSFSSSIICISRTHLSSSSSVLHSPPLLYPFFVSKNNICRLATVIRNPRRVYYLNVVLRLIIIIVILFLFRFQLSHLT